MSLTVSESARPSLDFIPEWFQSAFTTICWSLLLGVWLAAAFGPIYALWCFHKRSLDSLLTFLCLWFLGGMIKVPYLPSLSESFASGLESWFKSFTIKHEHAHSRAAEPDSPKNTIYCYHPHGLFSLGMALLAADLVRRGEKIAIVASNHMRFFNPVAKIILDMAGIELVGASPREVQAAMKRGDRSLILVPGGYEEAVMTQNGFERLYLDRRMGFVKYAMRYGYTLTPVYAYGENDFYVCVPIANSVRSFLAQYKLPLAIFYGDTRFPLLPRRTDHGLHIVVGEAVKVIPEANPSLSELHRAHNEYKERLIQLYYRYNKENDRPLEVL